MKIEVLTTFLEDRERFVEGDVRTVDDADGARFVWNGWAKELGSEDVSPPAAQPSVDLDIHNVLQTSKVTHG